MCAHVSKRERERERERDREKEREREMSIISSRCVLLTFLIDNSWVMECPGLATRGDKLKRHSPICVVDPS